MNSLMSPIMELRSIENARPFGRLAIGDPRTIPPPWFSRALRGVYGGFMRQAMEPGLWLYPPLKGDKAINRTRMSRRGSHDG